jgi:hypothetical protein
VLFYQYSSILGICDLVSAFLNEAIGNESWYSEFSGEVPSGHFKREGSFTFARNFQAVSVNGKSRNHLLSPSTRSAWFISMMQGVNVGDDCMKKKGLPFGSPLPLTMLWH